MTHSNGEGWHYDLRGFLREFWAFAGRRGITAGVLVSLGAMLEGFGLILIVPLLGIVIGSTQAGGRLGSAATASFQRLGVDRPFGQLALLLGLFSVLMVARAIVLSLRDAVVAELQAGFVEARRASIVERLAAARWDQLVRLRHARVTHVMSGDIVRIGMMAYQASQCAIALALVLAQGVLVFLLAPMLAVSLFGLLAVAALALLPGVRRTHNTGGMTTQANLTLLGLTAHFLGGLKTAMSQNLQSAFVAQFRQTLHDQTQFQIDAARQQTRRRLTLTTVSAVGTAALVLVGFGVLDIPPPILITLLLVVTRMVGPIGQIQQSVQLIAFALPAYRAVGALERELAALPGTVPVASAKAALPSGPIVFHNVSFRHATDEVGAKHGKDSARGVGNINLVIEPGEVIGIAGQSGAGKTTFADLMVGLFPAQHGRISIGGVALDDATLSAWRDRVGYLSQDAFLFQDSVRRNLAWAQPQIGEAVLWQALAIAGADGIVRAMPQGIDTPVGERGALVSGGERQRIALARVLLRQPRLLVLDEATSALDVASEREIVARLRTIVPRPTIVMIAHRAETIALCDRVLRFEAGHCVDDTPTMPAAPLIGAQQ